ncbi:MAG: hypothetical protein COS49_01820 [Candidatus Portnoybacteria bacterium CG03_land_8_20_14_0_80_41_10]|uniref:UPF0251 protein COS49_01820 n=1 Tax=Candidatus Portnoybacteria bacterium CG03_land_8_20_14_0_80_41_10 TaxID=1974808 RepID=A0A2M7BUF0_9BACT|nr:MAG: hypothetical protein COS49_01820 [Candidatus Portnoybacteria bacterium CG03_land_8_20_14_0_80_41_10]
MPRPFKKRAIGFDPRVTYFKPRAVPLSILEEIDLGMDELEALRLCELKKLEQAEAAKRMKISQSTLQRILSSAHQKIAEALTEGKAIRISKNNGKQRFRSKAPNF